jgi:hypothetical protein
VLDALAVEDVLDSPAAEHVAEVPAAAVLRLGAVLGDVGPVEDPGSDEAPEQLHVAVHRTR